MGLIKDPNIAANNIKDIIISASIQVFVFEKFGLTISIEIKRRKN